MIEVVKLVPDLGISKLGMHLTKKKKIRMNGPLVRFYSL